MLQTNGHASNEVANDKTKEELEDMCPQTKVILWDGEQFDEFEAEYLNQIYPEKLNKHTISDGVSFVFHFLSGSLYYWVQIQQAKPPNPEKLSKKDIQKFKDELNCAQEKTIQRWSPYFNQPLQFKEQAKLEDKFVVPGKLIHTYTRNKEEFQVFYSLGNDKQFLSFKERFEVLLLMFVDGASFTEHQLNWHYYVVFKRNGNKKHFVGLLSKYEFRLTFNKQRDRISQVLILPPYQKQGHGRALLDLVYEESLKNTEVFEITVEGPSFEFQCLRDFKEAEMLLRESLLRFPSIQQLKESEAVAKIKEKLLNKQVIRQIKERLKLPGHQIQRVANILVYACILKSEDDMIRSLFEEQLRKKIILDRSAFKTRQKRPYLHVQGEQVNIQNILLERSKEEYLRNRSETEQILSENLNGYKRVIAKLSKINLL